MIEPKPPMLFMGGTSMFVISCFQELEAAIIQRFWTEPEAEKSPPSTQRTGWTER